ncbi:hypothetical protein Fmac_028763 [Flemingia macrophylla]|uniref:Uncharacterized protein n=1 Tax=Flemingia macrophylla TaxID=520843 RepID=A0ABD1L8F2_9FABA
MWMEALVVVQDLQVLVGCCKMPLIVGLWAFMTRQFKDIIYVSNSLSVVDLELNEIAPFHRYNDMGFTVNGVEYEGSLLCVGNLLMSWKPKKFSEITADSVYPETDPLYVKLMKESDVRLCCLRMNDELGIWQASTCVKMFSVLSDDLTCSHVLVCEDIGK